MTLRNSFFSASIAAVSVLLCSCGGGGDTAAISPELSAADTIAMRYARNITMVEHDGFTSVTMRNPWDTTLTLARYILIPAGRGREGLPDDGSTVIEVPLRRAVVYSATHNALLSELGASASIAGVCGAEYINDSLVVRGIDEGRIVNCGNPASPDFERIISLRPDGVMFSSMEGGSGQAKLGSLGIPLIECADYMEESPLARAEWMRFFGRLVGEGPRADSLFEVTDSAYNALRLRAASAKGRPKVVFDRLFGGVWNVPGRYSTTGRMLADAGASNPFDYIDRAGSSAVSAEQVLDRAHDADFWLIRYNQPSALTLEELAAESPVYRRLGPWDKGRVYGCNTAERDFYDVMPFHPQIVLADIISVIHPETGITSDARYFIPLEAR